MNFSKTLLLTITLTFLFYPCSSQENKVYKKNILNNWNKLNTFISLIQKKQEDLSFYTALVWDGKIISEKQNGYANIEKQLKMSKKVVHRWASVSKLFTTIAVLQLVEKGKIKMTDPIVQFFPNLGKKTGEFDKIKKVKIHHLLNHNSGLSLTKAFRTAAKKIKKEEKGFRRPDNEEFLPYLELAEQSFSPGKKYKYSNMGFSLLGMLIEKVSGIKFKTYIKQNVLIPLKMFNTSYGPISKKMLKKQVIQYAYFDQNKDGKRERHSYVTNNSQGVLAANGGIRSTCKDMLKFMNFLKFRKGNKKLNKILKDETLKKYLYKIDLKKGDPKNVGVIRRNSKRNYSVVSGFEVNSNETSISIGHSGKVSSYISYFLFNKKRPFGIMMISNMYSDPQGTPYKLIRRLVKLINNFSLQGNFGEGLNFNKDEF